MNVGAAERGNVPSQLKLELRRESDLGSGIRAHGQAQLANDLWVAAEARNGMFAYGYGPGAVQTEIRREIPALFRWLMRPLFWTETRSPQSAAADIVRLLFDRTLPPGGFRESRRLV